MARYTLPPTALDQLRMSGALSIAEQMIQSGTISIIQEQISRAIEPLSVLSPHFQRSLLAFSNMDLERLSPLLVQSQHVGEVFRQALGPLRAAEWLHVNTSLATTMMEAIGLPYRSAVEDLVAATGQKTLLSQMAAAISVPAAQLAFSQAYSPILTRQLTEALAAILAHGTQHLDPHLRRLLDEIDQEELAPDAVRLQNFFSSLTKYARDVGQALGRETLLTWISLLFAIYVFLADQNHDAATDAKIGGIEAAMGANAEALESLLQMVGELPPAERMLVVTRRARVRTAPANDATIVDRLDPGDTVVEVAVDQGWIKVSYPSVIDGNRHEGWVYGRFLATSDRLD